MKSLKKVKNPIIIAGVQADVVEYDIPLLLSKKALSKAKTQIDYQKDKVNIFGKKVKIYFPATGYCCIKLESKLSDENVFKSNVVFLCSNVQTLSNTEKYKVALKPHRQFYHPEKQRLLCYCKTVK